MTNNHWQEFKPWLRDLLLEWHRIDPVSEKEKLRAIEVNKIQGNRNPFIDYPQLVDYIWGEKQEQVVDFTTLEQTFGNEYGDITTTITTTQQTSTSTHKIIQNNQVVIVRNGIEYTLWGVKIE
jgi:hypothetical protein